MEFRIAFLRGVNVGGHHKVPMKELTALFQSLGSTDIQTYIQSGNVAFRGAESLNEMALAKAIEGRFGFPVPVVLRSRQELKDLLAGNPFLGRPPANSLPNGKVPEAHHLAFFTDFPVPKAELVREKYLPDEFAVVGKDIHLYTPNGLGKTRLDGTFFRQWTATVTVRNVRTVTAMIDLTKAQS